MTERHEHPRRREQASSSASPRRPTSTTSRRLAALDSAARPARHPARRRERRRDPGGLLGRRGSRDRGPLRPDAPGTWTCLARARAARLPGRPRPPGATGARRCASSHARPPSRRARAGRARPALPPQVAGGRGRRLGSRPSAARRVRRWPTASCPSARSTAPCSSARACSRGSGSRGARDGRAARRAAGAGPREPVRRALVAARALRPGRPERADRTQGGGARRSSCARTIHLVSARDCLAFHPVTGGGARQGLRARGPPA